MPIIKCVCLDNARVVITNVCRRTVHIRKGAGEQKRAYNLCHKNSSGKCDIANKELYTNTSETEATQFTVREMKIERCLGVHLCLCVCKSKSSVYCTVFLYHFLFIWHIFSSDFLSYPLNNTEHGNKRRGMQTGWKDEGYGSTMASPKIS